MNAVPNHYLNHILFMSFIKKADAGVQCTNVLSNQNDGINDHNNKPIEFITKNRVITGSSFDCENPNTKTINLEDHQIIRYIDSDGNESYSLPIKIKSYTEKIDSNNDKEMHIENHINFKRFNGKEKDKCFDYYEYMTISRYFDMNENKMVENITDFDAYTINKNIKIDEETKIEKEVQIEEVFKRRKFCRPLLWHIGGRYNIIHDYYLRKTTFNTYKRFKLTDKVNHSVQFGDWVLIKKKTEITKE